MNADDFFSGWAFMVAIGPFFGIINAIIALPSTLFSKFVHKRAGFIAWVLTVIAILAYWIFPLGRSGAYGSQSLISPLIYVAIFWLMPQAAAYSFSRNHPWLRPLIAGGLVIGVAILYMILGFLLGATPD